MYIKSCLLVLAVMLAGIQVGHAQKYGHCNLGELVNMLPGTRQADSELEAYQEQLVQKGEDMATSWRTKAQAYATQAQSGDLTPKQMQEQEAVLKKEQEDILQYEQEIAQLIGAKREELLTPLIERVEKAIAEVAQEEGIVMVFDTSAFNAVLYADDSSDITEKVKAKLGIQ